MEKLKQALRELQDDDYMLFYESIDDQAKYILSIARDIIKNEKKPKKVKKK